MKIVANSAQTTSIQNAAEIVNTVKQQGVNRIGCNGEVEQKCMSKGKQNPVQHQSKPGDHY